LNLDTHGLVALSSEGIPIDRENGHDFGRARIEQAVSRLGSENPGVSVPDESPAPVVGSSTNDDR